MTTTTLTDDEIHTATEILKKLSPGILPRSIFFEVMRLMVSTAFEIVPLRKTQTGNIEVLLIKRPSDDPFWPDMLHTPGTIVRPSDVDATYQDAIKRILNDELKGTQTGTPVFVGNMLVKDTRGSVSVMVHWAEVIGEPQVGTFYDIDSLPHDTMSTQIPFITMAVEHYTLLK